MMTPGAYAVTAAGFNATMRSLQAKRSHAERRLEQEKWASTTLISAQQEIQREIDAAVLARAEEIIKQRDEVARKAGELMAGRRARRPEHPRLPETDPAYDEDDLVPSCQCQLPKGHREELGYEKHLEMTEDGRVWGAWS